MIKRILYIGRFQPFHLGHLDAVKQIFAKENPDMLLIAIGSAQDSYLPENPFTAGERFEMIETALAEEGIPKEKYSIMPICDINQYSLWTDYVCSLLPPFQSIYSGSKIVKTLFSEHEKDIQVHDLKMNLDVSATEVRKKIINGENLEDFVPQAVIKLLDKYQARERLLKI